MIQRQSGPRARITRSFRALSNKAPFFFSLALHLNVVEDTSIKNIAGNGVDLRFNPDWVNEASADEIQAAIAYVVTACALKHHTRRRDREQGKWQLASHLVTHPILVDSGITTDSFPHILAGQAETMSAEQVYELIPDSDDDDDGEGDGQGGGGGGGQGQTPPGEIQDYPQDGQGEGDGDGEGEGQGEGDGSGQGGGQGQPDGQGGGGNAPQSDALKNEEQEWDKRLHQAATMAKGIGNLPGNLSELIDGMHDSRMPWQDILREFMTHVAKTDYTWNRPNRRLISQDIYMPSLHSEGLGPVVLAIDTSGSMDNVTLAKVWSEIRTIAQELEPERLLVIHCDHAIQEVEEYYPEELPDELEAKGRGGTSIRPVMDYIEDEGVDAACMIYYTDLEISSYDYEQANEPTFPVLWGCLREATGQTDATVGGASGRGRLAARKWWNGRHGGLRSRWASARVGSSPAFRTTKTLKGATMYRINDKAVAWLPPEQIEPQAREQIDLISQMPFIHRHVAAMPDCHLGIGATVGSMIPTDGAIIPATVGVDIGCFVGETKVPLLDGTQKTLRKMAESGEDYWVYSVDPKSMSVVPGRAKALKTRLDAPLFEVVVSGGESIICTPDHEFMLSDGTYKRADALQFNDSLMPLYRRWAQRDGYEKASNGKGNATLTHKMVYEYTHGQIPAGHIVHHVNHNHFDNRPENLVAMTAAEHSTHHRKVGHAFNNADPDFQKARLAGVAHRSADPEKRAEMARVGTENVTTYMRERPDHFKAAVKDNGKRGAPVLAKFNVTPRDCSECGHTAENPAALRWHKEREHASNHKVLSTRPLADKADVYCLQVPEHHNFALAAGVFVHNCGMMAVKTPWTRAFLPADLRSLREDIARRIPLAAGQSNASMTDSAKKRAYVLEMDAGERVDFYNTLAPGWRNQLGTLGSGNHFIEIVEDENGQIWAFLHSGSRGVGNKVATHHIREAKTFSAGQPFKLPHPDLAYLLEGTSAFDDYIEDLLWCQDYAADNREEMMDRVMAALALAVYQDETKTLARVETIQCHHNFSEKETHFGKAVWVSRKGAIRAEAGDMGLIPGSMGTRSYVVRGKGNAEAFNTAPHGAGRRFSRGEARRRFTLEDMDAAMGGIEYERSAAFLDEHPNAYKDVDTVMLQSKDLVEIVHTFRQIVNVKGASGFGGRRRKRKNGQ